MLKLIKYLYKVNLFKFVLLGLIIILFTSITTNLISNEEVEFPLTDKNIIVLFFGGVILAPFLETIIFQALSYRIVSKLIKHKYKLWVYILFSAIAFMLIHPLNIGYMIATLCAGFILALFYYVATFRKESAVLLITIIHMGYNFFAFGLHIISKYMVYN